MIMIAQIVNTILLIAIIIGIPYLIVSSFRERKKMEQRLVSIEAKMDIILNRKDTLQ